MEAKTEEQQKIPPVEKTLAELHTSIDGISTEEVQKRLEKYGQNAIQEKKISPMMRFLRYFWGPIPWMIEVAAVLSAVVGRWSDLIIISLLLLFNAGIGFWQEFKASNALEALKSQLALKTRALRDGKWQEVLAAHLVPGDIIRIRLGDIIPADVQLLEGDYLSVDQSALTGESLPVSKKAGEIAYSGTIAKQGEMVAVVTATGMNTFFGRTADLVQKAGAISHFQKAVLRIGDYLIYLALGLVAVLITVELFRGQPFLILLQFALILTVASIPVAMPRSVVGHYGPRRREALAYEGHRDPPGVHRGNGRGRDFVLGQDGYADPKQARHGHPAARSRHRCKGLPARRRLGLQGRRPG